jgi:UDP-3-O-[3-hydroxymyristoyl] glucosamine N-acyltransferase
LSNIIRFSGSKQARKLAPYPPLGNYVVLAGQAGVSGHIKLGDGAQVAAKSAALTSVEPGTQVAGIPAVELRKWRRQSVMIARLEEMSRRIKALEKREEGE